MALWEWDTRPEVGREKCATCKEPMCLARESAVRYQGKTHHFYCLLTVLTEAANNTSTTSHLPWSAP